MTAVRRDLALLLDRFFKGDITCSVVAVIVGSLVGPFLCHAVANARQRRPLVGHAT